MHSTFDHLTFIRALYSHAETTAQWHGHVLDVCQSTLAADGACGLAWVREHERGRRVEAHGSRGLAGAASRGAGAVGARIVEALDRATYDRFYYPRRRVTIASELMGQLPRPAATGFSGMLRLLKQDNLLGLLAHPAPGLAAIMWSTWRGPRLSHSQRFVLQRVRIHVESALRLRLRGSHPPLAILSPSGRLEHWDPPADSQAKHATNDTHAISDHVAIVEAAHASRARDNAEHVLGAWRALVEGRWSVVEQTDSDGKRYYLVFENAPASQHFRALTAGEANVVDQAAKGLTGRQVAYALGLTDARVSAALSAAAHKLGFRSRTDLLRAASALQRLPTRFATGNLTSAELEVLDLVRLGHSNETIAALRGRSVSTVANQIASILHKTGVHGRRGLAVLAASSITD